MLRSLLIRKQFSLASLFVVVTLIAIVSAGLGLWQSAWLAEQRAREEARIAEMTVSTAEDQALTNIAAKGGRILLYTEGAYVEFYAQPPGQLIVDCGTGLKRNYRPSGSSLQFQDEDLKLFDGVLRVLSVDFRRTSVSADAVAEFRRKYPQCRVEN